MSLLGALVAGGASGGAAAETQIGAQERQAAIEKQLIQQRADVEQQMQQATEQRHIQYAANLRTAMDQQLTPATEKILNAQGKTSQPQSGDQQTFSQSQTPNPLSPAASTPAPNPLASTGGSTDYAQAANGLLAGPSPLPSTTPAPKTNLVQASPTDMLTARALAMVQTGWVSNPDDVLKAAVTLNDTTQTSEARLEASKAIAEASILASSARGREAAGIHVNNPASNQHNIDVNLRGQAENLRKQLNDQYKIMTDPLASPTLKTQAAAKKDSLQKVLDGIMTQQASGQSDENVVQSPSPNAVSWDSLAK